MLLRLALVTTLLVLQGPVEALDEARVLVNDDPAKGIPALAAALDELAADPASLSTEKVRRARTQAQLTLVRALLAAERRSDAVAVLDEVIRTAGEDEVPSDEYGPGVEALERERREVLEREGMARLNIFCEVSCLATVNERPRDPGKYVVFAGTYRVVVRPAPDYQGEPLEPLRTKVALAADAHEDIHFGEPEPEGPPPLPTPEIDENSPRGKGGKGARILPRWVEVSGLVLGAAVAGTGGALIAIEGSCPGGANPNDIAACPQVRRTLPGGIASLAIGGAFAVTSVVLLAIDEVRERSRKRGVTSIRHEGLTLRF